MPALRELQEAFGRALLDPGAVTSVAGVVAGDGLPAEARLRIYGHHVLTSLTGALKATFPVVCRLVDDRFFAYVADQFIRRHPPTAPCLFEYGAELPEFLAALPACAHLVYLPDVARLEWAVNVALHAPGATPIEPEALAAVSAADLPRLRARVEPSLSLIASPWPIDRIWRANQPGADPGATVDLGAGGVCLEIRRRGDDVVFRALDGGAHALRARWFAGSGLGEAMEAALEADPQFDLARGLRDVLDEGIVIDLEIPLLHMEGDDDADECSLC